VVPLIAVAPKIVVDVVACVELGVAVLALGAVVELSFGTVVTDIDESFPVAACEPELHALAIMASNVTTTSASRRFICCLSFPSLHRNPRLGHR